MPHTQSLIINKGTSDELRESLSIASLIVTLLDIVTVAAWHQGRSQPTQRRSGKAAAREARYPFSIEMLSYLTLPIFTTCLNSKALPLTAVSFANCSSRRDKLVYYSSSR